MQMKMMDTPDVDTTEIDVVISDLVDSDGMGWTDSDGDEMTDDPIVTSITFGSKATGTQLVSFTTETGTTHVTHPQPQPRTHWLTIDSDPGTADTTTNIAGFNTDYEGTADYDEVIKLVYDGGDEVFADRYHQRSVSWCQCRRFGKC